MKIQVDYFADDVCYLLDICYLGDIQAMVD